MVRHKSAGRARHPPSRGGDGKAVWVYGRHAVRAALANPARRARRLLVADAEAGFEAAGAPVAERAAGEAIAALLPAGAVHQGVALLVEPLEDIGIEALGARAAARERAAVVVLDQVQDPQNVGAVLRSSAALGAVGMVLPERGAPGETGALAKAASGALETVPVVRVTNLVRALEALKSAGLWCVGLDAAAEAVLEPAGLPACAALVLGAEGRGLRRLTREHCDLLVRIEMAAGAPASLNVSAAAAIALYAHARGGRRAPT